MGREEGGGFRMGNTCIKFKEERKKKNLTSKKKKRKKHTTQTDKIVTQDDLPITNHKNHLLKECKAPDASSSEDPILAFCVPSI